MRDACSPAAGWRAAWSSAPCHEVGFDLDTGTNATSPGVGDDQPTAQVNVEAGRLMLEVEEGS